MARQLLQFACHGRSAQFVSYFLLPSPRLTCARTGGVALRPPTSPQSRVPAAAGYEQLHAILSLVQGRSRVRHARCHVLHYPCFLLSSGTALHFPHPFVNIRCQHCDLLCHREEHGLPTGCCRSSGTPTWRVYGKPPGAERLESTQLLPFGSLPDYRRAWFFQVLEWDDQSAWT